MSFVFLWILCQFGLMWCTCADDFFRERVCDIPLIAQIATDSLNLVLLETVLTKGKDDSNVHVQGIIYFASSFGFSVLSVYLPDLAYRPMSFHSDGFTIKMGYAVGLQACLATLMLQVLKNLGVPAFVAARGLGSSTVVRMALTELLPPMNVCSGAVQGFVIAVCVLVLVHAVLKGRVYPSI